MHLVMSISTEAIRVDLGGTPLRRAVFCGPPGSVETLLTLDGNSLGRANSLAELACWETRLNRR